jgi:thiol-disulfide isomerase/thioredoxin
MSDDHTFGMNHRQIAIMIGCVAGLLAAFWGIYSISSEEHNPNTAHVVEEQADTNKSDMPEVIPARVTKDLATGKLAAFVIKAKRTPIADIDFIDETGARRNLSQWRGRVVLLNLWATWCAPCRKEMPDLAKLQKLLGGEDFEVIALSVDRKGAEASAKFLIEAEATALTLYLDQTARSLGPLQAIGLPATYLIDRQGNEIGRLLGPADWSSKDALKLILSALKEGQQ